MCLRGRCCGMWLKTVVGKMRPSPGCSTNWWTDFSISYWLDFCRVFIENQAISYSLVELCKTANTSLIQLITCQVFFFSTLLPLTTSHQNWLGVLLASSPFYSLRTQAQGSNYIVRGLIASKRKEDSSFQLTLPGLAHLFILIHILNI